MQSNEQQQLKPLKDIYLLWAFKYCNILAGTIHCDKNKELNSAYLGYEAPGNSNSKERKKNHFVCPLVGRKISGLTADYGFPIRTALY